MNVFEYAMKMELDGKNYFEEYAATIGYPELKDNLSKLAHDDEYFLPSNKRDRGCVFMYQNPRTTGVSRPLTPD